ncbi:MAG: 3-hydroxyacyl-[acyl-carrier-protein] dehydratase FabZ [Planctomycetaceae bacterium]|nr:3-hydroxyacyl-[acyl-carrier-protein] dehydratase FabZ [Planctomycetaceae bacterium]
MLRPETETETETRTEDVEDATTPPAVSPRQHTLGGPITVEGLGLLLGAPVEVTIEPADPDHGIVFERIDLDPPVRIPALVENVVPRGRRTTLKSGEATIETVEHCMSALAGLGIDNALIRIHGPELPGGDGSARPFIDPLLEVGVVEQDADRRIFDLQEAIVIDEGDAMIAAIPHDSAGMRVVFDLDYNAFGGRIKRQVLNWDTAVEDYVGDLSSARTFSLEEEAKAMWERGIGRHLTPKDVLVIGEDGPIENTYRFEDEPVRHKILDMLGDLYLVGCPVRCRVVAYRSGHGLNRRLGLAIREQMAAVDRRFSVQHGRVMDIRMIQRTLPHRYPMLLVDRVIEMDGEHRAVGVKNVTMNEHFFQGHYPGTPIMPGVLIIEAMAQMGGLLLSQRLEHTGKIAVLLSLDKVKIRKPVAPGDQLILEAERLRASARLGHVRCKAMVDDRIAAEADIKFMLVDAEQE